MALTGLPTGSGDDLVTVTPTGQYSVNGEGGTDTLRVDYRTLSSNIDYRYVANGWYTYTDDFFNRIDHYGFERYELWFGAGDDVLNGAGLNDSLSGGAGNDRITSGLGADSIDGGIGKDRWIADYSGLNVDVKISLLPTDWVTVAATGAQVRRIEEVTLASGSGADLLNVRSVTGNHSFDAGAGDDVFRVKSGVSSYNGGAGFDRLDADFSAATSRITQVYTANGWHKLADADGSRSVDFYGVEQFWLTGGSAGDSLWGADGNDKLIGNGGNDWLNGAGGNDTIQGGDGIDTWQANFGALTTGLTIDLNTDTASVASILGIEAIHALSGKGNDRLTAHAEAYNDSIYGNDGNDVISTGRGKDTVDGGAGTDTLVMNWGAISDNIIHRYTANGWYRYSDKAGDRVDYYGIERFDLTGGAGNDWLGGGSDKDTLRGGLGDDTLNSGEGRATIDGGEGNDLWEANLGALSVAAIFDAADSQANSQMTARSFDLRNIERVGLTLGAGDDSISTQGFALDDWVTGAAGDDTVNLGTGHDTFNAGDGTDLLILDYSAQTEAVTNRYTSNGWYRYAVGNDVHYVDHYAVEQFSVNGGNNDDVLTGGALRDTLRGGIGDDVLNSGAGTAMIDGGAGNDRWEADLTALSGDMVLNAAASQSTAQMVAAGFSVRRIEAVNLSLGIGNDDISTAGYALDDTVNAGDGRDKIALGLGFDVVNGGAGTDILVLDYSSATSRVSNWYTSNGWYRYGDTDGTMATDHYAIERFNVKGGLAGDLLDGGALADTLIGGGGNDVLNGGTGGADRISGGYGDDTWVMNLSASTLVHHLTLDASGAGVLSNNGSNLTSIENVQLSTGEGDDVIDLSASTGNHVLSTGAGNDLVNLGQGLHHSVDGGAGTDTLIGSAAMAEMGVRSVYVSNGWYSLRSADGAFSLDYYAVEQFDLTGSARSDNMFGHGGNDTLRGAAGADILNGGAGDDVLFGGAGADQFWFSMSDAGVDLIADAEVGDFLRLSGVGVNSLTSGDGTGIVAGQAQIQSSGGVTSIFLGLDGTAGYDFRVDLTGTFDVADFQILNSGYTGADLILI
ncbi:beta strand repeat-containing protein [Gemmobacter nectariphilus]|uniref:beta strand repeat-containing protein n=1 Tax=Gemmobacter nectariphilus TaxID=220343 RepID=UPI00040ED04B|nr:calcium-binding protein [Gemmobacter nectariphilus]